MAAVVVVSLALLAVAGIVVIRRAGSSSAGPSHGPPPDEPTRQIVVGSGVAVVEYQSSLAGYDLGTQRLRWVTNGCSGPSLPPLVPKVFGSQLLVGCGLDMRALDVRTGTLGWRFHQTTVPLRVRASATAVVLMYPNVYVVLDMHTGKELWRQNEHTGADDAPFTVDAQFVYLVTDNGIEARRVTTGRVAWTEPANLGWIEAAPGGIVTRTGSHSLERYRADTGDRVWTSNPDLVRQTWSAIWGVVGNVVIVRGTHDNNRLVAYSFTTGHYLWTYNDENDPTPFRQSLDADRVAIIRPGSNVVILDATTGERIGESRSPAYGPVATGDGYLVYDPAGGGTSGLDFERLDTIAPLKRVVPSLPPGPGSTVPPTTLATVSDLHLANDVDTTVTSCTRVAGPPIRITGRFTDEHGEPGWVTITGFPAQGRAGVQIMAWANGAGYSLQAAGGGISFTPQGVFIDNVTLDRLDGAGGTIAMFGSLVC